MKKVALEHVSQALAGAREPLRPNDPVVVTKGSEAIALLLLLPKGITESAIDALCLSQDVLVALESKHESDAGIMYPVHGPVPGSCVGMLEILHEDDEHLKDFEEYMK